MDLIIPSWAKKPEPPAPRDLKAEMLAMHPLPWKRGEEHESMCRIVDAVGGTVCTIRTDGFVVFAGMVAGVLLGEKL